MSEIGIITNPHSKLNRRNPKRQEILSYILGKQGRLVSTESIEQLTEVAESFKEAGIRVLAINGGDGTISRTLSAFIHVYGDNPLPKVALLRGGTMNVVALNLGIRGTPERLLYKLIETVAAGGEVETQTLSTLKIDENFGFLYADGTSLRFLEEYYENKSGVPQAVWLFVRIVCSSIFRTSSYFERVKPMTISWEIPDQPRRTMNVLGGFASTIAKLPLWMPFFSLVRGQTKCFQALTVTCSSEKLLPTLPKLMLKGREGETDYRLSYLTNQLKINSLTPLRYTLDGEIYEAKSEQLVIELGPEIEFVRL